MKIESTKDVVNGNYPRRKELLENIHYTHTGDEPAAYQFPWLGFITVFLVGVVMGLVYYLLEQAK